MSKQIEYFNFLKSKKALATILLFFVFSVFHGQTIKVNGKVVDDVGMPLPGVSVLITGTKSGSVTDFEGNFTIPAKVNDELIFSYIGFSTQKVKVKNNKLNIKLMPDVATLGEVVVVGYATEKKNL